MSLHLFSILGFNKPVSLKEVKTRYKELAKRYHPDLCKEPGAEERFKLVSNAYQQILKLDWLPKEPPQPRPPRANAEQICWRVLQKNKTNSYRITYPNPYILQKTRFNFMILNHGEFSIFFEEEKTLPIKIEVKLVETTIIEVVEGYD